MHDLDFFSLKARNFKCFAEEFHGFEKLRPVNLIVGRNNTGKSSLLDLIEAVTTGSMKVQEKGYNGNRPEIQLRWPFTKEYISYILNNGDPELDDIITQLTRAGRLGGTVTSRLGFPSNFVFGEQRYVHPDGGIVDPNLWSKILAQHERKMGGAFANRFFRRVSADRDIRPEKDEHPYWDIQDQTLDRNGTGATTVVQRVLQNAKLNEVNQPSYLISKITLDALNQIYGTDDLFSEIDPRRIRPEPNRHDEYWEIFLREGKHNLIPLSETGSGIKTVLLVLLSRWQKVRNRSRGVAPGFGDTKRLSR